jgi:hypothetical protein
MPTLKGLAQSGQKLSLWHRPDGKNNHADTKILNLGGNDMSTRKTKHKDCDALGSGMELIRGGIKANEAAGTRGCICSPGGYEGGRDSSCGCACGCITSPAGANMTANNKMV